MADENQVSRLAEHYKKRGKKLSESAGMDLLKELSQDWDVTISQDDGTFVVSIVSRKFGRGPHTYRSPRLEGAIAQAYGG
jgi:hypothetical protein